MNKESFLLQLERLLYDIPKEERDEAMDYYRNYFEDAGEENEAVVLEELESPQMIADSIKEALSSTGDMAGGLKNPPQVREGQAQSGKYEYGKTAGRGYKSIFSETDFQKKSGQETSSGTDWQTTDSAYQKSAKGAAYRRYDQQEDSGQYGHYKDSSRQRQAFRASDRRTKLILFIIVAVFASPIWGTVLSGVLAAVGVIIAAVVVLGACCVGGIIGGIACTAAAVIRLCTLSLVKGLFMLGIGMLLIAGGGISMILLLLVCGRLLPWAVRQTAQLFHRVLQWGRSAA